MSFSITSYFFLVYFIFLFPFRITFLKILLVYDLYFIFLCCCFQTVKISSALSMRNFMQLKSHVFIFRHTENFIQDAGTKYYCFVFISRMEKISNEHNLLFIQ